VTFETQRGERFVTRGVRIEGRARDLAERTLAWGDHDWDAQARLVRAPDRAGFGGDGVPPGDLHLVPQSAWHAFGCLLRGAPGDRDRARCILETLLPLQYDEPGAVWHGTFARFSESPRPPREGARIWTDYDPNWRQFLGTAFLWTLRCFPDALPAELVSGLERAVRRAVTSEPPDRVHDSYANIALMKAWLEVEAGARLGEPAWVRSGEALAGRVAARFDVHGAFDEFNSPTYYGIDLFALALWARSEGSSLLASEGPRLAAALWRDLAGWYHAGLANVCGPYTRTYGMDLSRYVALLSLWLWRDLGAEHAPLPPLDRDAAHGHDLHLGPLVATLASPIPDDARDAFVAFPGPHAVRRRIGDAPRREATGWLDADWMAGAEHCEADLSWWDQYVGASLHWRLPAGGTAWLAARAPGPVRASADRTGLVLAWDDAAPREATLRIEAAPLAADAFARDGAWSLPGLSIAVEGTVLETKTEADAARVRLRSVSADGASRIGLRVVLGRALRP
jgi:hypothetical protein